MGEKFRLIQGHKIFGQAVDLFDDSDDLSLIPPDRFFFDSQTALDMVDFFGTYCRHIKGEWKGQPITLERYQRKIVRDLFGWKRIDSRLRKHRRAYIEVPRKNAKSTTASGIALILTLADHEPGAEVYSAAADKDQARIVFDLAAEMVRSEPVLMAQCEVFRNTIFAHRTGSVYRVLSADVKTKHGLNSHGVIFDELHTQDNRDLWDVLRTSMGSRRQPVMFSMTTAGYDEKSICYQEHDYALKCIKGILKDETLLAVVYGATEEDDWTSEEVWKKANPMFGVSLKPEYVAAEVEEAKRKPANINIFKRLQLNIWTAQRTVYIPMKEWDACAGTLPDLEGRECYGGLDLASTEDVAAHVLVFPRQEPARVLNPETNEEEETTLTHFDLLCRFWLPKDNMDKRVRDDRINYDLWHEAGWLELTPGNITDYAFIRASILRDRERFDVREIAYDRWNSSQLISELTDEGLTMVPFGQGFGSMGAPTKNLLTYLISRRIRHEGSPVLRWMASNVTVKQDPAGAVKPDKANSREKIDGIVAAIMGLARAEANANAASAYEAHGIRTL